MAKTRTTLKRKAKRAVPMKTIAIAEFNELRQKSERADALMMDIGLDAILRAVIGRNFPHRTGEVEKLMNSTNMIQKARLANILQLIDGMVLKDLEQIHEIRNRFGHSFEARFSDGKVRGFVKKLSTAKDKTVTEKNCYKFYDSALIKCANCLDKAAEGQSK